MKTTTNNIATISSQRYLDADIVDAKAADHDYACSYVNVTVEGVDYRVLVDGHHSYAAAMAACADVEWTHNTTIQQDVDALGSIAWLESHQHDSDWYDLGTGDNVWQ